MTGLTAHSSYLYLGSRSQNRTYRYELPGLYGRTASTSYGSGSKTWDIARDASGLIWVADDNGDYSVECYDSAGEMVAGIARDMVSHATGVAMDEQGTLWVSNNQDGMIYGMEVSR